MPDTHESTESTFQPQEPTYEEERFMYSPEAHEAARYNPMEREIQVARSRARKQLDAEPPYPDIENLTMEYPGISPNGMFSRLDTDAFARLTAIQDALPTRPPEIREFVSSLMNQFMDPDSAMASEFKDLQKQCKNLREISRAAQLAPSLKSHKELLYRHKQFETLAKDKSGLLPAIKVMEYAVGTSDIVPDKKDLSSTTFYTDVPYPKNIDKLQVQPFTPPKSLPIHFQNFDHVAAQQFYQNPKNRGTPQTAVPADISNPEAGARIVARYAAATVDRTLNPLFDKMENIVAEDPLSRSLDRGGLITVDGKTVRSIMREQYKGDQNQFHKWYAKNVKQMTGQIVSAGLMAGKRVEAYVPDRDGRLPKAPTQLTRTGYKPSPVKKVTLNAWERHFAKHGFYKEKSAKAAEYQRVMAGREEMRVNYTLGCMSVRRLQNQENLFFEKYKQEHGMDSGKKLDAALAEKGIKPNDSFRCNRTAHITACICQLAAQGHPLQDILDPNKLSAERSKATQEYVKNATTGNTEWLGETYYKGMKSLMEQADQLRQSCPFEEHGPLMEAMPWLRPLGLALQDAAQEIEYVQVGYYKAAEASGDGIQSGQDLLDKSFGLAKLSHFAQEELEFSAEPPTNDLRDAQIAVGRIMRNCTLRKYLKDSANPDYFNRICDESITAAVIAEQSPFGQQLAEKMAADPTVFQAVKEMAQTGELQKKLDISFEKVSQNGKPVTLQVDELHHNLSTGPDGKTKLETTVTKKTVNGMRAVVSPTKELTAAMEKKVKSLKLQNDHPKPEAVKETKKEAKTEAPKKDAPQKDASKKDAPKKEAPKKTAPKKDAPVKDRGGMKR